VILLGSQIQKTVEQEGNWYILAPHTKLKAQAAGIAWKKRIAGSFVISGGYNFNVRYSTTKILKEADFSLRAFTLGRQEKSEAEIIAKFLKKEYEVPVGLMFLEELSATTQENAEILKILLRRTTFNFAKRIAILTLIYHMERALPKFRESGLNVEPLFAEDLLALQGEHGVNKVCAYYSLPKGGKLWPIDEIRELLSNERSIKELLK
jgi:hypothetical protein